MNDLEIETVMFAPGIRMDAWPPVTWRLGFQHRGRMWLVSSYDEEGFHLHLYKITHPMNEGRTKRVSFVLTHVKPDGDLTMRHSSRPGFLGWMGDYMHVHDFELIVKENAWMLISPIRTDDMNMPWGKLTHV